MKRTHCNLYIRTLIFRFIARCCLWMVNSYHSTAFKAVASSFVSLHVAADAEGLPASLMWAFEWLLSRMRVGVNSQT